MDLQESVKQGDIIDQKLVDLETAFSKNGFLNQSEIESGAAAAGP